MPDNSVRKTFRTALGVCLICSILVSGSSVLLRERHSENKRREKLKNVLIAGGLYSKHMNADSVFQKNVIQKMAGLETGHFVSENLHAELLHPERFDLSKTAAHPELSRVLPSDNDPAGIRRQPLYMPVYLVMRGDSLSQLILSVYGKGLWSTMYGFLSLDADLATIRGFTFYDHGETPGLGGEIDNPDWRVLWEGKQAYDQNGNIIIRVIKGKADINDPLAHSTVDGISGATLTSRGVNDLVRFWLGPMGYRPFLNQFKQEKNAL